VTRAVRVDRPASSQASSSTRVVVVRRSSRPSFVRRFIGHRAGVVGACVVALFAVVGLLAPFLAPYDPLFADPLIRLQAPSAAHLFGTDELGRDILSRLMFGTTISMRAAITVVTMGLLVGVPVGAITGYFGGVLDLLVQRIVDTIQAFPGILFAILVVALVGPSLELTVAALGFLAVPTYARLVRGSVLVVKQLAFIEAARTIGCGTWRVLFRHVLPNSITPVIIQSTLQSASALLLLAGISFLGLGVQPPTPEWGSMLAGGRGYLRSAPHLVLFPGLAVSLVVLGLNLVGDALRDALDPRLVHGTRR
jgi:peptide/nickel transport system permease protein